MSDDLRSYPVWAGPRPLQTMMLPRWDAAFDFLFKRTSAVAADHLIQCWLARTTASKEHGVIQATINDLVEVLYERRHVHLALSWQFLAADPKKPETIQVFIPQVASLLSESDGVDGVYTASEIERLRATLNIWMDAADGRYVDQFKFSLFAIADAATRDLGSSSLAGLRSAARKASDDDVSDATGLVVMPKGKASKLVAETSHWKDMVGKRLPFVMVQDVLQLQATLRREYPHAWNSIGLLTRDLREDKPVRLKPVILLGDPGSGKSRMVRRLGQLLRTSIYRFDGSSVTDAVSWAGTARGWGNTTPSVPARAVLQAMQANPIVLIDEIEKGGSGNRNGSLHAALTPFLERETSQRLRDLSLDAELDLSWVSYIATANDVTELPAHIRDRFRVVRVPLPTLDHLRPLARGIMADLAAEEDLDPRWMAPLDADEEAVIAKAWQRAGFSIRKLQKIISATLEARDTVAMRQ
jgi:hypothetical protein